MGDHLEDIEDRISSLKSEIKSYGQDIIRHISSLYSFDSSHPINLKNDPRDIVKMLQMDVKQALSDAQQHSAYTAAHKEDIQACATLTTSLEEVAAASLALESADEAVVSCDLPNACKVLENMQNLVELLPTSNSEIGAGPVCRVLKHSASLVHSRFQARLRRLVDHAIRITRGRIQVLKSVRGGVEGEVLLAAAEEREGIPLRDIWQAILTTNDGSLMVDRITQQIWNDVVTPLWQEKKILAPSVVTSSSDKSGAKTTSDLSFDFSLGNVKSCSDQLSSVNDDKVGGLGQYAPCRMKYPHLLEAVNHVMAFMYSEVFLAIDEVVAFSCDALRGPTISFFPTLSKTLLAILPKTEADMESLQTAVTIPCREFEQKMNLYGFLSNEEARGDSGPLTAAVQTMYTQFLSSRRTEILAKARSLVLCDYHNTMLGTGDALDDDTSSAGNIGDRQALLEQSGSSMYSPFQSLQFESCQISLACCRLLKLVHEVLKQASGGSSSAALAQMLYRTSRDCLEIFEGVVQSKYADSIQCVARMGAVFFNDCVYIAHNTTLLTHMYRQELGKVSPELAGVVGFIDFIPRFRLAGEQCLAGHVEAQKRTLRDLVSAIGIQAGDENEEESSSVEGANDSEAALRVVKHLQRLQGQWQYILQESVYERLMGYLLEYVLRGVMKPIFEAKYISEAAASDVSKVFKVLQKASTLFENALPVSSSTPTSSLGLDHGITSASMQSASASGHSSAGISSSVMAGGLVSWLKFCAFADLLEFSLSDISEWLPRRKFAMFTGQEMSALIRALFEDSPRRQNILSSILEMAS